MGKEVSRLSYEGSVRAANVVERIVGSPLAAPIHVFGYPLGWVAVCFKADNRQDFAYAVGIPRRRGCGFEDEDLHVGYTGGLKRKFIGL